MDSTQVAPANAPTMFKPDVEYTPESANLARRTISIFSRRGTELSEPKPAFIEQGSMGLTRTMTERQKAWLSRRRSVSGSISRVTSPKKTAGAVPHAIPPPKRNSLTALEDDAIPRPSVEEIVRPTSSPSQPTSPRVAQGEYDNLEHLPLDALNTNQRTHSQRKRDVRTRIGTWVDGLVRWDVDPRPQSFLLDAKIEEETGLTPLRPEERKKDKTVARPHLEIKLPEAKSVVSAVSDNNADVPDATSPVSPLGSSANKSEGVASKPVVSEESTSTVVPDEPAPRQVNASSEPEVNPQSSVPTQDAKPKRASHSSSSCSSPVEEAGSVCSKRSSATSVEEGFKVPLGIRKRHTVGHHRIASISSSLDGSVRPASASGALDKPLPPMPRPLMTSTTASAAAASEESDITTPLIPKKASGRRANTTKSLRVSGSSRGHTARDMRKSMSMNKLDDFDRAFMLTAPASEAPVPSPTLSQAENDLTAQLSNMTSSTQQPEARQPKPRRKRSVASSEIAPSRPREAVPKKSKSVSAGSVHSVMRPPEQAPSIPKRSRKRDWKDSSKTAQEIEALMVPSTAVARRRSESEAKSAERAADAKAYRRTASIAHVASKTSRMSVVHPTVAELHGDSAPPVPVIPTIVVDDGLIVVNGPTIIRAPVVEQDPAMVQAAACEEVLLHILAALTSTEDLAHMAVINKGMYRVYKENDMSLVRRVSFNQSPPAWEFREWCTPDQGLQKPSNATMVMEYTPQTWVNCQRRDSATITSLKKIIVSQCSTLRTEVKLALINPKHEFAQRIDDAFWRIWCFCFIFGYEKGREEDITGQLDWLRGGIQANNQGCVATVNTNLDFEMGSVLLNAPEYFAGGNYSYSSTDKDIGLNAEQLFDMTEIWTCLMALLQQGYLGHIELARKYGVFDKLELSENADEDEIADREDAVLEEWTFHLLTLGLDVVLAMAECAIAQTSVTAGFQLAQQQGWTKWTPSVYPDTTSPSFAPTPILYNRSSFLKEPVTRLYEERILATHARRLDPRAVEQKEIARKRMAALAKEIKLRRQTSAVRRLPLIDMNNERPMSMMSRRSSILSTRSFLHVVPNHQPGVPASGLSRRGSTCADSILEEDEEHPVPPMPQILQPHQQPAVCSPLEPEHDSSANSRLPHIVSPLLNSPAGYSSTASPSQFRKISPIIEEESPMPSPPPQPSSSPPPQLPHSPPPTQRNLGIGILQTLNFRPPNSPIPGSAVTATSIPTPSTPSLSALGLGVHRPASLPPSSAIPTGEAEDASSIADSSSLGFRSEADVEEEDAARRTLVNMGYSEEQADEALWLTRTTGGGGEGKMRVERAVEVLMRR
jgi:hypothetical protein